MRQDFDNQWGRDYGYRREVDKWTTADVILISAGLAALVGWVCLVNYFFPV